MHIIPNPTLPKLTAIGKSMPRLLITLTSVSLFFHEWFTIGLVTNPADIAQYPFGSEEAMSDGGWYYLNASFYARTLLTSALMCLVPLLAFGFAVIKRTTSSIEITYCLFAIAWLTMYVLGHYHLA